MAQKQLTYEELGKVLRVQRNLLWLILGYFVLSIMGPVLRNTPHAWVMISLGIIVILIWLVGFYLVLKLMGALRIHWFWRIFLGVLMIVPLVGLLILLSLNSRATKALRNAGLRVGFMGASMEDYQNLAPGRCSHCGYSLEHLTEARCPECGEEFDPVAKGVSIDGLSQM